MSARRWRRTGWALPGVPRGRATIAITAHPGAARAPVTGTVPLTGRTGAGTWSGAAGGERALSGWFDLGAGFTFTPATGLRRPGRYLVPGRPGSGPGAGGAPG